MKRTAITQARVSNSDGRRQRSVHDPPEKEAAPSATKEEGTANSCEPAYNSSNGAQAQSHNGSNGQQEPSGQQVRNGPITKILRYGKHHFVQILQATVRDSRLSLAARGLLAYLLSLPEGWQPHPKQLKAELGLKQHTWEKLMKELRERGYTRLRNTRSGSHWEFCEWPKWKKQQGEISTLRFSQNAEFAVYKNDRGFKNDRKGSSGEAVASEEQGRVRIRKPR